VLGSFPSEIMALPKAWTTPLFSSAIGSRDRYLPAATSLPVGCPPTLLSSCRKYGTFLFLKLLFCVHPQSYSLISPLIYLDPGSIRFLSDLFPV